MSDKAFKFKEFSVEQNNCAMKVGTDGVLLGAWTEIGETITTALDIGTGTGLIALQLAQRNPYAHIDALEIEDNSYVQAVENFENSPWADRLFCYHASLKEFSAEMDEKYQLIVCNPPFYNNSFPSTGEERNLARQIKEMSFKELLASTSELLDLNGTAAFILPYKEEEVFIHSAAQYGLNPYRITRLKGNLTRPVKRSLVQFSFSNRPITENELILETERHVYTPEYKALVKDFYLNL